MTSKVDNIPTDDSATAKQYASSFDMLRAGTLFRSVQKENTEPENIALGQISKDLAYLQRQHQYVTEIERVLKELRLTVSLIKGCMSANPPQGVSRQELLTYYQGNFLTLVHQMKDKIVQLIHLMTEQVTPEKPSLEKDISVSDLLQKKLDVLRVIGIEGEIKEWVQESPTGGIAVALRKRTQHHHRVSGLRYDKDFLNLGFTDIATQEAFRQNLSDYGKERIEKMRLESTERLFSGALYKAENTLKAVEDNLEKISCAIVRHFKLPFSREEVAKIINDQSAMLGSFEIINRCAVNKIPQPHKGFVEELVRRTGEEYKNETVAIYLVGSLARGEYEEGYSDVNIYVVTDLEDSAGQITKEDLMFGLNLTTFTKRQFLSDECRRYRVIAKADGVLLYGIDLVKEEKLPKAGLLLALILNDDILDVLNQAEKWMKENPTATPLEISRQSRRLAKRIIDFIYGVAMSNKPQYTASRKERVEKILEAFPDKKVIDTLMGIARYGVGEFESFKNTIEGFRPKAEHNIKKMLEVKKHIEKTAVS